MRFRLAAILACALLAAAPALDLLTSHGPLGSATVPLRPPMPDEVPWAYSERVDFSRIGEVMFGDAGWLVAANTAQIGGGIFGTAKAAQVLTVGPSGSQFSTLCGIRPGAAVLQAGTCADPQADCKAGSALKSFSDSSATKPYIIVVNPGVYNECVVFDNRGYIEVLNQGIIRPTIPRTFTRNDSDEFIQGGVVRYGSITTSARNTHHIVWTGSGAGLSRVHDDGFDSPESAFQLNRDTGVGAGNDSTWDFIMIRDEFAVGLHDTLQLTGDQRNTTGSGPPLFLVQNVRSIGGRDNLVMKASAHVIASNVLLETISNFCESTETTRLGQLTPSATVEMTAGGKIVLEAAHQSPTPSFYQSRYLLVTDFDAGGAGECGTANSNVNGTWELISSGHDPNAIDYGGFVEADASGCGYIISGVRNFENPECNDVVWRLQTTGTDWKITGIHARGQNATITNVGDSRLEMTNSTIRVESNDVPPVVSGNCNNQVFTAGLLVYTVGSTERSGDILLENVDIELNNNTEDKTETVSGCAANIGGIVFADQAQVDGTFQLNGVHIEVNNTVDPNQNIVGIGSVSDATGAVIAQDVTIDLNQGGGFTGLATHLLQTSASGISVTGSLSSPELILTSGAITGWDDHCVTITDAVGTDDDVPMEAVDALVGLKVQFVSCSCQGTCTNAETVDFQDEANNNIQAALACTDNAAAATWTDVRAVAAGVIPVSTSPRFDIATAPPAGDNIQVCMRYTTTRWNQ